MIEEWRTITGYPDYQVSNTGKLRSFKGGGIGRPRRTVPRVLKSKPNSKGYLVHILCEGPIQKTHNLHRLVIEHFGPPRPPGTECSHLDGVRSNCSITNLVWEAHKQNMRRQVTHGTDPVGVRNGRAVLQEKDVKTIRSRRGNKETLQAIANDYGITFAAVWRICRRLTWSHVD